MLFGGQVCMFSALIKLRVVGGVGWGVGERGGAAAVVRTLLVWFCIVAGDLLAVPGPPETFLYPGWLQCSPFCKVLERLDGGPGRADAPHG